MTHAQAHRGPDGGAVVHLTPTAAFGHRRLAIVDLSSRAAQPMTSRDGRWTIVLNGEIFNYRDLRSQLPGPWASESDTEVFLEAVAEWGLERALDRAIGMFAFGLWDHREEALLLARDRAGEKPLVYYWDGNVFAFASELKALAGFHENRVNAEALDVYLALGYVPAPLGIFRATAKLPAGHWARWQDGRLEVRRWWCPEETRTQPAQTSEGRRRELRDLAGDAVQLRLLADVPVALALSGGIDSSVLAAEVARLGEPLDVFTVVFDGDESDLPHARAVAERFGLRQEILRAGGESLPARVEAAMEQYDEPFADSSSIACLALARTLAGSYKVVLTGDGGDEAFAGYRHYEFIGPKQVLKAAAAAAGLRDGHSSSTTYVQSKTTFRAAERARLLKGHGVEGALDRLLSADPYLRSPRPGALKRALWSDRHLQLANGLTYKSDMAFSAYGIEGRAPLLDHRILEWAQNLPDHDLVRGREKKVQLRQAYAAELPASVLARPKHGFGAPVDAWLAGPLRELAGDTPPCALLDRAPQAELRGQRQWTLFTLALWARKWKASW